MTGCAGPKGILPFLLWFGIGLLSSLFSTVAHADSGTLYVTAENVLSMMKSKQDALLIDVRDRDAFDKLRIPGSIHIALYSLKTKAFLRNKPLVLVSEGYSDAALELTCRSMRDAGFTRAFILDGGLRSWTQKKGPVEGDALSVHQVSRVQPKHFVAQKDLRAWLVVAVSEDDVLSSPPLIAGTVYLPLRGDPKKFVSALKAIISRRTERLHLSVLICDESEGTYEGIERAVQQEEIEKVFYLKGGLTAYRALLQQQSLLVQRGKEEVKRCMNCQ
ncbi:MAG: rhodanese-like domain-containing protein [Deltaproteobacteria bacterium]